MSLKTLLKNLFNPVVKEYHLKIVYTDGTVLFGVYLTEKSLLDSKKAWTEGQSTKSVKISYQY